MRASFAFFLFAVSVFAFAQTGDPSTNKPSAQRMPPLTCNRSKGSHQPHGLFWDSRN